VHEVVPSQVQDPAFAFVEPHQVPLFPAFQPIQVTLNGSTAFRCIYIKNFLLTLLWQAHIMPHYTPDLTGLAKT